MLIIVLAASVFSGCQPGGDGPGAPANQAANSSQPDNSRPAEPAAKVPDLPVTMPLVDAMFADETFADEAKRAVQLSDEELEKLKNAARDAVLKLDGGDEADASRSTRAAAQATQKDIEAILGPERAAQFLNFIRTRWGGSGDPLVATRPNAVPTDTRIVVNAPAYRMDLFKDGKLIKTYKVGIGYPEFPLPTGVRNAKEIIFNPTWTPPDEPWVKGKVQPGKTVEAGSKLNPLGPIKIPIGLPSLIHGGKDPSRLGTFASHGCVGLTSPMVQEFAMDLSSLSGTGISMDDIKGYERNKTETKETTLAQPVAVELRYETIVAEDGKVTVYRDVYERGTNTEENLRKVLEAHGVAFDELPENERAMLLDAVSKMAVDAQGDAVTESAEKEKKNTSAKVTRNIKGEKEIVVQIAALRGKGYPSPVNLVDGQG